MSRVFKGLLSLLLIGALIGGAFASIVGLRSSTRFPIRGIELQGELKYITKEEVINLVSKELNHGFFGLDVEAISRALKNLPWLDQVFIKRVWPDKLLVTVREQNPQAYFGETGMLSTGAKVFYPPTKPTPPLKLPKFTGPESRAKEMLDNYFTFLERLAPLGLKVEEILLSDAGSWQIVLEDGMNIILGKVALEERLGRFALAYPKSLHQERPKIAYLDLRYPNGFAIGWKKSVEME